MSRFYDPLSTSSPFHTHTHTHITERRGTECKALDIEIVKIKTQIIKLSHFTYAWDHKDSQFVQPVCGHTHRSSANHFNVVILQYPPNCYSASNKVAILIFISFYKAFNCRLCATGIHTHSKLVGCHGRFERKSVDLHKHLPFVWITFNKRHWLWHRHIYCLTSTWISSNPVKFTIFQNRIL